MALTDPTPSLVYELLTEFRRDVVGRLERIETQARMTNGSVADLKAWRIAVTAVADDRNKRSEATRGMRIALMAAALGGPLTVVIAHFF